MEEITGNEGSSYKIVIQIETLLNKLKIGTQNEDVQNVSSASSIEVSHERGEDDDYLQLLSKCSCLKHIANLLDDIFEINLKVKYLPFPKLRLHQGLYLMKMLIN